MKITYFFILPYFVFSITSHLKPFYNNTIHWTRKKTIKLKNFLHSNLDVLYL